MSSVSIPVSADESNLPDLGSPAGKKLVDPLSKPTSRKSATVTFQSTSLNSDLATSKEGKTSTPIISQSEKEELLALLENVPQQKPTIHSSYSLLPYAYNLLLAVTEQKAESTVIDTTSDQEATSKDTPSSSSSASRVVWNSEEVCRLFTANERRKIYLMVYHVMPLTSVIDELLSDSNFYSGFHELYGCPQMVRLMTYNFIQYKFTVKPPTAHEYDDTVMDIMAVVAKALWQNRIKLSSAYAKLRVERGSSDLKGMLEGSKKDSYQLVSSIPQHCRVLLQSGTSSKQQNFMYKGVLRELEEDLHMFKGSIEEQLRVISALDPRYTASFAPCNHFEGLLLAFAHGVCLEGDKISRMPLLTPQDLSSFAAIERFRRRLDNVPKPCDVILTHFAQGTEALHMSTLLGEEEGRLIIFDVPSKQEEAFRSKLNSLSISNVLLCNEPFTDSDLEDLQEAKAVFCNPPCSLSSVPDSVNYAMIEGEHLVAPLLSVKRGTVAEAAKYTAVQMDTLNHCLTIPGHPVVAYFVRSHLPMETSEVITASLDQQKDSRPCFSPSPSKKKTRASTKRTGRDSNNDSKNLFQVKVSDFMSFLPEEKIKGLSLSYGYFLTILEKPKKEKEVRSVIENAIANGLIKWNTEEVETTGNITVEKVKKYKHNYLKPTASVLAKSRTHTDSMEFHLYKK